MKRLIGYFIFLTIFSLNAQDLRVEPMNWWSGMNNSELQLLIHGKNLQDLTAVSEDESFTILATHNAQSPNYLFIDISLKNTKPGVYPLLLKRGKKVVHTIQYEIKNRTWKSSEAIGFNSKDAIYLITPDRFANGDSSNDIQSSLKEQKIDRNGGYSRHGGDIQGINKSVDYIKNLGFTAIWPSPLLTNDMPDGSYHGYAITDFYQVDPRFGTLEEYIQLSKKLKDNNMKLIMDMVANHCGSEHWWMKDLPFDDWINNPSNFKVTNHRRTTNEDPYASEIDKDLMTDGWFVPTMPDMNQKNAFMAKYLIQNSIWWVETLHLGGIRQDTYPYPDKQFMSHWAGAIMQEYPNFSIVGEEWSYNPLLVGYWQEGIHNKDGYESHLSSTMDFPMQQQIADGLMEEEAWGKGLIKIYEGLANDFYYAHPDKILLFGDNHDMDRIYTQLKKNPNLTKIAVGLVAVLPRIPQFYYGTEILMDNSEKPGDHGLIRTDMPGGWNGDKINAFNGTGLNQDQKSMQQFTASLFNFRKTLKPSREGDTKHFAPENEIYVIFRWKGDERLMIVVNKANKVQTLDMARFNEMNFKGVATEILTNKEIQIEDKISLPPVSFGIYQLK